MNSAAQLTVRRTLTTLDETADAVRDGPPLRKAMSAAIIANPYSGTYQEDLGVLISWGAQLGTLLGTLAAQVLAMPVMSYGKAAIVGTAGQQEHGVACLTTAFGDALRAAVGGGLAWISSATKRGTAGCSIDVPLAHKDALYVRDCYDALLVTVAEAPMPDEIVVIAAVASRGRLGARCGGLRAAEISAHDGLR
jgi:hypothetical protein